MSRKGKSFVGQPVVFWERKNGDQCFGEEKELDDREGDSKNRIIIEKERRIMRKRTSSNQCLCRNRPLKMRTYKIFRIE